MRVRFWGTRGSIATPGPGSLRYGGNTSCIEVRSDAGSLVVLDCGTGARLLGQELIREAEAQAAAPSGSLLIGHTHWDHIQGIPFFAPLFHAGSDWQVYGPRGLGPSLAHTLSGQMQYQYFPVTVEQLAATVTFHDLVEGGFEVGDLSITTQYLNHPALTLAYRIEADGVSVVYACDHEPYDPSAATGTRVMANPQDGRHVSFLAGADLLIHDAQYRSEEYAAKLGWGHSTAHYAVDVARLAGVGELALSHHDPERDDDAVDALVDVAQAYAVSTGFSGEVFGAAEGTTREVWPRATGRVATAAPWRSATYQPTATDLAASVVITATDPVVVATFRAAAEAELLPVVELTDLSGLATAAAGVLVVDHDEGAGAGAAIRRVGIDPSVAGLTILAVTRGRPPVLVGDVVSDWLVWPASIGQIRTKLRAALLRRASGRECSSA